MFLRLHSKFGCKVSIQSVELTLPVLFVGNEAFQSLGPGRIWRENPIKVKPSSFQACDFLGHFECPNFDLKACKREFYSRDVVPWLGNPWRFLESKVLSTSRYAQIRLLAEPSIPLSYLCLS